ncbi:MAG: sporulation protein YabP [Lachnospiraceae bacterium]|nr:sporulation protein YabP [Lachnospiraceae bacterium]
MENLNNGINKTHKITMTNRHMCLISGVKDVLSFDVHEVLLETEQGMLTMKGDDLHVSRLSLDQGEVDVDGRIDSLVYSEVSGLSGKGESLFAKLFR